MTRFAVRRNSEQTLAGERVLQAPGVRKSSFIDQYASHTKNRPLRAPDFPPENGISGAFKAPLANRFNRV